MSITTTPDRLADNAREALSGDSGHEDNWKLGKLIGMPMGRAVVPGDGVPQFSYFNHLAEGGPSPLHIAFHTFI